MTNEKYEELAIKYAEKHGIIDFRHSGRIMIYFERFSEGRYRVEVDLESFGENRVLISGS